MNGWNFFIRLDFLYECAFSGIVCYNIIGLNAWMKEGMLLETREKVSLLAENFAACSSLLTAIGDETRLHIILEMMKMGKCSGVRIGEITKQTNLSRPAVSHHLQIMKNAGIVKLRKEGTKHYYYFDSEMEAFERLIFTLQLACDISKELPDRHCESKTEE